MDLSLGLKFCRRASGSNIAELMIERKETLSTTYLNAVILPTAIDDPLRNSCNIAGEAKLDGSVVQRRSLRVVRSIIVGNVADCAIERFQTAGSCDARGIREPADYRKQKEGDGSDTIEGRHLGVM